MPLKCKIFNWLTRRRRLPTNERRHRHQLAASPSFLSCPEDEDVDHLLLMCPRAREVWDNFFPSADHPPVSTVLKLWDTRCRNQAAGTTCTAISWSIWKRRNDVSVNSVDEPLSVVRRRCVEDLRLWAHRCSSASTSHLINTWCISFDPREFNTCCNFGYLYFNPVLPPHLMW